MLLITKTNTQKRSIIFFLTLFIDGALEIGCTQQRTTSESENNFQNATLTANSCHKSTLGSPICPCDPMILGTQNNSQLCNFLPFDINLPPLLGNIFQIATPEPGIGNGDLLPGEGYSNSQTVIDAFSWQTFVALNVGFIPSEIPVKQVSVTERFGSTVPIVQSWLDFEPVETLLGSGFESPCRAYLEANPDEFVDNQMVQNFISGAETFRVMAQTSKSANPPITPGFVPTATATVDPVNSNIILYDERVNPVWVAQANILIGNGRGTDGYSFQPTCRRYDADEQAVCINEAMTRLGKEVGNYCNPFVAVPGLTQVCNYPGPIEIKAAWKILSGDEYAACVSSSTKLPCKYITEDAFVYAQTSAVPILASSKKFKKTASQVCFPAKLGLVALHINHKIFGPVFANTFANGSLHKPDLETGIWSTFEHVDNAPDVVAPVFSKENTPCFSTSSYQASYSFFLPQDPLCNKCAKNIFLSPEDVIWNPQFLSPESSIKDTGTNILNTITNQHCQHCASNKIICTPLASTVVTDVNDYFQGLLQSSVLSNYQLRGSQWTLAPFLDAPGQLSNFPNKLTNSLIEAACQEQARLPIGIAPDAGDQGFLTDSACTPNPIPSPTPTSPLSMNINQSCIGCHVQAPTGIDEFPPIDLSFIFPKYCNKIKGMPCST